MTQTSTQHADLSAEDRTMAMLCHLLAIFTGFIGPLIIWLIKKDSSNYVDAHGRAVLNFAFTLIILNLLAVVLLFGVMITAAATESAVLFIVLIPIYLLLIGVSIGALVLEIIHCVQANRGEFKPYPFAIRFFKSVDPYA